MKINKLWQMTALLLAVFFMFPLVCWICYAETTSSTVLDSGDVSAQIGSGSITIHMIDSVTSAGLAGIEFELCSLLNFSGTVFSATTNASGSCTFDSLSLGLWYLREKTGLAGYIPYTTILPVSVGLGNITLNLKSTPYGSIEVKKIDDFGQVVQGAKFSLYNGSNALGIPIQAGLTSDSNGKIVLENITPGTYTLLETDAPAGYHLNPMLHTFEVVAGSKRTVEVVNNLVQRGTLHFYKRDAQTGLQLAGAVLGVYRDPLFADKLTQVVSLEDAPAVVSSLMPDTYYVKELSVPNGYLADAPPQTIVLTEGKTLEVTFFNSRSYPTAGNFALPLLLGISGLVVCGFLALFLRNHR